MVTSSSMNMVGIKQRLISNGVFTTEYVRNLYQENHKDKYISDQKLLKNK